MEKPTSRRVPKQARSQERYQKILTEAANLFSVKGFDGTTTNEIARHADVSIGSVYQYFDNKEAIVGALSEHYVEELKKVMADVAVAETEGMSTPQAVERLLGPILKFHLNYPEFRALWLGAEVSPELRGAMGAMDDQVRVHARELLHARVPDLSTERMTMTVTVIELAIKSLLGLIGRSDDPVFQANAATETKRMLVSYLDQLISGPEPER